MSTSNDDVRTRLPSDASGLIQAIANTEANIEKTRIQGEARIAEAKRRLADLGTEEVRSSLAAQMEMLQRQMDGLGE